MIRSFRISLILSYWRNKLFKTEFIAFPYAASTIIRKVYNIGKNKEISYVKAYGSIFIINKKDKILEEVGFPQITRGFIKLFKNNY